MTKIEMKYPKFFLIIGVVGFLFFVGITLLSNLYPNETVTWWTTVIFVLFSLGSVYMILISLFTKHYFDDKVIEYTHYSFRKKSVLWGDIKNIGYSAYHDSFILKDVSNNKYYISRSLSCMDKFAEMALIKVEEHLIDPLVEQYLLGLSQQYN